MTFISGFRGTVNGAVQAYNNYTDQPGVGIPGMLVNASDYNYTDSFLVAEANGIRAGKGIVLNAETATIDIHNPPLVVNLPTNTVTAATFGGITVFDQAMQTDDTGHPGWAFGRNCRVLRPGKEGGRIWVPILDNVAIGNGVNLVHTATGSYNPGDFSPTSQGTVVQAAVSAPFAGNTGNGSFGAIDATAGTAELGIHKLVCFAVATNAGKFQHFGPDGLLIGIVTVGVAYTGGGLTFTIADGATDFVAGDGFTVTVTESGRDSVLLTNARWITAGTANGLAAIELF